jgi:hypothetical protein
MTGENPKLADRRASGERMLRELLGAAGMARNWLNQVRSDDNGLVFDGKLLATSAELDTIFASVSLTRELETGEMDQVGRFNEAAVQWEVGRPWVDQRVAEIVLELGVAPDPNERRFQVIIAHDVDRTTCCEYTFHQSLRWCAAVWDGIPAILPGTGVATAWPSRPDCGGVVFASPP